MSRFCISSSSIAGRSWRLGHPFRPRSCKFRRVGMWTLLLVLCLTIFGYGYITDATRIREMAEAYLSQLVGGRVTVDSATLSIFEGLRLEGVRVYVDESSQPDSLLFSAQSFVLKYDPAKMIRGQLEAAQIIAQKPHVHLTLSPEKNEWNFNRLGRGKPARPQPQTTAPPSRPPPLPAVLLRNARVEINELRNGTLQPMGYEAIDGQLIPLNSEGAFLFDLQARGKEGIGPWASGRVAMDGGPIDVEIHDFNFSRDVRSILWTEIADFWDRHAMAGAIDALHLHYVPKKGPKDAQFLASMTVKEVNFRITPDDWLSPDEIRRRASMRDAVGVMQSLYRAGGYRVDDGIDAAASASAENPPSQQAVMSPEQQLQRHPSRDDAADARALPASSGATASAPPASPADAVARLTGSAPVELVKGSGKFIFSNEGVKLQGVTGRIEGNAFVIDAEMKGYSADAPFTVIVQSADNETFQIPLTPRYLASLPQPVRELYALMRPDGRCTMWARGQRLTPGARPLIEGRVDVVDGVFSSVFFPYPLREAQGTIRFGYDSAANADFVHIQNMRGRGLAGGPNRDGWIAISGDVGPLGPEYPDPQVVVRISGNSVYSEPALLHAMPKEVQEPLKIFDAEKKGKYPIFHGSFNTTVLHPAGSKWKWTFDTDLHLDDASGRLVGFPYLLEHVAGDVQVRNGYVDIINAHCQRGLASMRVDGRVTYPPLSPPDAPPMPVVITTDMAVKVHGLPIDKELLNALPPLDGQWVQKIGVNGTLDVTGRIYQGLPDPSQPQRPIQPMEVRFDLDATMHDGTLWPANGTFSVAKLTGRGHLTPEGLKLSNVHGERGTADLTGDGMIAWGGGKPEIALRIKATHLPLDSSLYSMLPPPARQAWDSIQPIGAIDADMSFRAPLPPDAVAAPNSAAGETPKGATRAAFGAATVGAASAASQGAGPAAAGAASADANVPFASPGAIAVRASAAEPSAVIQGPDMPASDTLPSQLPLEFAALPEGFRGVFRPRALSCTLRILPYRLDDVRGKIDITPEKIVVTNLTGRHGGATFVANGTGAVGEQSIWDLKLSARNVPVDDELRRAMPPTLVSIFDATKLRGVVDIDFPKFIYRGAGFVGDADSSASTRPAAQDVALAPGAGHGPQDSGIDSGPVDIDLSSVALFKGATLDLGIPITDVTGKLRLDSVSVRQGKVSSAAGELNLATVNIAGRTLTDLHLGIDKPAGHDELDLRGMHASLAGGKTAGEARLEFPADGPSKYYLSLALRNADIATMMQGTEKDLRGELNASLSLEGRWDQPLARRGRGDVLVSGNELYHLPLVMGLFQVTNLSLPLATPFKVGAARFSVDGQRINFDRIELKSDNMLMEGDGYLDFKTKKVAMTFTTDNPTGLKVPFINDLLKSARGELLRINVRGAIQQPRVEANPFGTFTTTVDEVFKADKK